MLRAAPGVAVHEKGSDVLGRGLKKLLFFCFAEVGGVAGFGARNPRLSSLVVKEMNCRFFVVFVVFLDLI